MEYEYKQTFLKINNENETIKKNKGCVLTLAFLLILILIPILI